MATATKARLKIVPLGERVVIKPVEDGEPTQGLMRGGLYIPDTATKEKLLQGEVVAVGPGRFEKGERIPMELKVGDRVIYGKYAGTEGMLTGEEVILMKESDVIAKLA